MFGLGGDMKVWAARLSAEKRELRSRTQKKAKAPASDPSATLRASGGLYKGRVFLGQIG
jgi:hypothetical protein